MSEIDWGPVKRGEKLVGCNLGPRHGVEYGQECIICTGEILEMMEPKQDLGPWSAEIWNGLERKVVLQSDDFAHDVTLVITGDFWDEPARLKYAQMIADDLNAAAMVRLTDKLNELQCKRALAEIKAAEAALAYGQNGSWEFGVFAELDHDVGQVQRQIEDHRRAASKRNGEAQG